MSKVDNALEWADQVADNAPGATHESILAAEVRRLRAMLEPTPDARDLAMELRAKCYTHSNGGDYSGESSFDIDDAAQLIAAHNGRLRAERDELRAALDEAECNQSATRNHAEVFYRRLVAAQDALLAYPSIVTRLVRGSYGIDVNEHQIDAWLRGVMSKDATKELAAHDARLLDDATERGVAWLIEQTSHIDPALAATNSGKWLIKLREKQTAELRAAIIGEEE